MLMSGVVAIEMEYRREAGGIRQKINRQDLGMKAIPRDLRKVLKQVGKFKRGNNEFNSRLYGLLLVIIQHQIP